jgi:hypothetical protein
VTRKQLGGGLVAALALVVVVVVARKDGAGQHDERAAAAASAAKTSARKASVAWPAGRRYAYALAWASKEDVELSAAVDQARQSGGGGGQGAPKMHAAGALDLEGRLELRSYGLHEGRWLVGARLGDLTKHHFTLNETNVLPDAVAVASIFGEREALAELASDGHVRAIYFAKDAPPVFRHMMKSLVTELGVTVPSTAGIGGGWTIDEETSLGLAHVRYAPTGTTDGELSRIRTGYARLTGLDSVTAVVESRGTFAIAEEGHLRALEQHDEVTGTGASGPALTAKLDLRAKLESVTTFDMPAAPVLADLDRTAPGSIETSGSSARALLDQQIAGLTLPDLLANLQLAKDGEVDGKSRFVWRSTGLLQRDPEACDAVGKLARAKATTSAQRALALDLLAGAGTPRAQAAMRDALASAEVRSDKDYSRLVQRLSFVQHPDRASGDFIETAYRDATARGDTDARYGTAYSLGAIAGHLAKDGDAQGSNVYADELKRDLGRAHDANERAQLLRALGGAGRPDDLPTILAMSADPDPSVRRSAANALSADDTAEGLGALLRLVADPAPSVQQAALRTLGGRSLTVPTLEALATIVERGALHTTSYGDLIALLAPRTAAGNPVVRMLQFVVAHSADDPAMATRAKRLLGESGGGAP